MNRQNTLKIILAVIVVIIIVLGVLNWHFSQQNNQTGFATLLNSQQQTFSQAVIRPEQQLVPSPLNGVKIAPNRAQLPVLAVMIENSPPARPQSALSKADVVYETLAEGGITRFMALFQSQEADVVGPVRSARTYFTEIVREYDAWYAHVGGNADAIKLIKSYAIHDLDQFFHSQPYWRDPTRWKQRGYEHSMYTNTNDLRKLIETDQSRQTASFESWNFQAQESDPKDRPQQQTINIKFSLAAFDVKWEYDPVTNLYKRFNGGSVQQDAQNDQQLTAKNVLVQYVKITPVLNPPKGDEASVNIQLIGEGEGVLFRDGKAIPLTWKKAESGDRTQFFDENGQKIAFNPGMIWIELAEKEKVSWE